jgi:hypothetical protein
VAVDGEPDPALLHARNPASQPVKCSVFSELEKSIQAHGNLQHRGQVIVTPKLL